MASIDHDGSRVFALQDQFADLVTQYKASEHGVKAEEDFKPILKVIKDLQFTYGRTASQAEAISLEAGSLFHKYLSAGKTEEVACDYVVLWVLMKELEADIATLLLSKRDVDDVLKIAEYNIVLYLEKVQLDHLKEEVLPIAAKVMREGLQTTMPEQKIAKDYLNAVKHELHRLTSNLH